MSAPVRVIDMTDEQLSTLVQRAVAAALSERPRPTPFLSLSEYAVKEGVSRRLVAKWRAEGLPVVRSSAGRVRVDVERADAWVRERVERRSRSATESAIAAARKA
ncbi:MAG: hypothetical protein IPG50_09480 [Myxococcales bacterium]|nr:hypothetical protein [Myxococcales bacterium]